MCHKGYRWPEARKKQHSLMAKERKFGSWLVGKEIPKEVREKIRATNRRIAKRVVARFNWKGGITPARTKIWKSWAYQDWRRAVFERDDYTCQECGSRGGEIQADHIYPFSVFPDLRFDLSNGRTLCKPCHRATDTFGWKMTHAAGTPLFTVLLLVKDLRSRFLPPDSHE